MRKHMRRMTSIVRRQDSRPMRLSGAPLATLGKRAVLLTAYGFIIYEAVISPKEPSLALLTWIVTFGVFGAALVLGAATRNEGRRCQGIGQVLKGSYDPLLPIVTGFIVVFTLNALHILPLHSKTLKDQPDMLIPVLLFHSAVLLAVLVEFYRGCELLPLGVAASVVLAYPVYGAANLNGYGTLLILILGITWRSRSDVASRIWTPSPLDVPLMAFLGLAAISTITSFSFFNSSLPLISTATSIAGALLIAGTIRTRRDLVRATTVITSVGVVLGLLGMSKIWILSRHFGLGFALTNRLWLPGSGPNGLAGHLVVSIPLMLSLILARLRRWLSALLSVLLVAAILCLVFSYSKGGWLGFVVSVGAFFVMGRRKGMKAMAQRQRWVTVASVVVGAVLVIFITLGQVVPRALERMADPLSLSSRAFFWKLSERIIAEHPLVGVGMNNYYTHASVGHSIETVLEVDVRKSVLYHPHSTYLDIAEGMGVTGLCAYLFLLTTFFVRGAALLRLMPRGQLASIVQGLVAAIMGFAVHGLFDLEFCSSEWKYGLFACMGLLIATERVWRAQTGRGLRYTPGALTRSKTLHVGCAVVLVGMLVAVGLSLKSKTFWPELAETRLSLNPSFFCALAEEKIQQGDFKEATELYEKAIARRRDYPEYHEKLGWLYWLRGDLERADTHFEKAVALDRLGAIGQEHYSARALFLFSQHRDGASEMMKNAIQTDPSVLTKAIWMFVPGDEDEAEDWLIRSEFLSLARLSSEGRKALKSRIIAHLKGDVGPSSMVVGPGAARAAWPSASALRYPPWSAAVLLNQLYERYLNVLATDPLGAKKILLNIGKGYYYIGSNDKAKSVFKEGLKFFKGDFNFRRALAVLNARLGEYKNAAELFSQVGDNYSEGVTWLAAKRYDSAIGAFTNVLRRYMEHQHPHEHARALTMIGKIYKEQAGPDSLLRAKGCYKKALFLSQTAANYKRLSDILYELDDQDEAKKMYRKALELHQLGQPLNDEPPRTLPMH